MDVISVFIQNRPGRLSQILKELEGFKIFGFSIADAGEFGIVRLCVDKPHKAMEKLKKHDLIAHLTGVIAVETDKLFDVVKIFEKESINIDDAIYAIIFDEKKLALLNVSNISKAKEALKNKGIRIL
ncbi:MAG: acetolactate synthase [Candidatus Methanofastidiosia archaeon]